MERETPFPGARTAGGGPARLAARGFDRRSDGNGMNGASPYQAEALLLDASYRAGSISSDDAGSGKISSVRFVNTYRPVVPLYETVAAVAGKTYGWRVVACLSRGVYRSTDEAGIAGNPAIGTELVWVPSRLRTSTLGANLFFSLLAPFKLMGAARSDLNIFLTHPPLFYVLGGALSRRRSVPYVVHLMDMYPEILARAGWLAEESRAYRLLEARSLGALQKAAGIVVIGRCMEERLIAKGIDPAKIHFIPNCSSMQVRPVDPAQNRFRQRHGLQERFVVMYSGNMGLLHELDTLLAVAGSLPHDEIRFVFVGNGRKRARVQAAIERGARNIMLLDYQTEGEDLANSLSAADVHFVSLRAGCEGLVVPSKFYGAMAAGRPVIYEGAADGEVARVIGSTGCGIVVPPGDVAGLRNAIFSLHADRELRQRLGATALEVQSRHYDPTSVASAYCRAISGSLAAAAETAGAPAEPQLETRWVPSSDTAP